MKVLFFIVTLLCSIAYSQGSSAGGVSEPAPVADDEELIIGDDEDIQKAQQGTPAETAKKASEPAVTTPVSSPKVESIADEDELKLDGGEENILDIVKPEVVTSDSAKKGNTAVSGNTAHSEITAASAPADSGALAANPAAVKSVEQPTVFVKKNADPQTIGTTGSINFARNLKEYRSPKVAMLMSLVVPGSGQIYAAHHSWKAAIYGAVEVGMVATGVAINLKGRRKLKDAHKFADQYYSLEKYLSYQNALKNKVDTTTYKDIYPFGSDTVFYQNAVLRNEDYYSDLKENTMPYVNGWDDAKPDFDENLIFDESEGYKSLNVDSTYLIIYGTDSSHVAYGFSGHQKIYNSKVSKADSYFKKSGLVLTLMLINHIVSAIDAGFTAKAHNDRLLNKKSVWQHIGLDQIYVADGGAMAPGYALKVRF
jgi:hypothetical protein